MSHLDLHVLLVLLLALPAGGCGTYDITWVVPVGVTLLIPQGIVLTRTFVDLRPHRKPWAAYLLVNELAVLLATALQLALTRR